jgi:mRNA-degrading endonuclease RelE of RelBE toxin-antitoxin system
VTLAVRWRQAATDELRALARRDPRLARRLSDAVERYAATYHGDVRKLQGTANRWRLRVGTWGVIFALDPPGTITVLTLAPRKDVYRS